MGELVTSGVLLAVGVIVMDFAVDFAKRYEHFLDGAAQISPKKWLIILKLSVFIAFQLGVVLRLLGFQGVQYLRLYCFPIVIVMLPLLCFCYVHLTNVQCATDL